MKVELSLVGTLYRFKWRERLRFYYITNIGVFVYPLAEERFGPSLHWRFSGHSSREALKEVVKESGSDFYRVSKFQFLVETGKSLEQSFREDING